MKLIEPAEVPETCFHGGAFFDAVGDEFDDLERRHRIINADVLDAWFPPSPGVIEALKAGLPWLLRTSPPAHAEGLTRVIARTRGVRPDCVLPGAGSSDLIHLALRSWLTPRSRVLLFDPTYGEYAHVLEKVIRCRVDRFQLYREQRYRPDLETLAKQLQHGYDLVVLVNPNSPTGVHVARQDLETLLRRLPPATRVWVDETYVEYAGANESIERFAAGSKDVIVCKSMSKVYALSGVRVAYLCGPPRQLTPLKSVTPPWSVSLPAQVAAVAALQDARYYADRHTETHCLRRSLALTLSAATDWEIMAGCANFLLCHLPNQGPTAGNLVEACREMGLFVRDVGCMGSSLGDRTVRIAVKDPETNRRMLEIIQKVLSNW